MALAIFFLMFVAIAGLAVGLYRMATRAVDESLAAMPAVVPPPEPAAPSPDRVAFVEALTAAGFWAHLSPDEAAEMRQDFLTGGFLWDEDNGRVYLYDETELGECGIRSLLEEARPFLEGQGVKLGVIQEKVTPYLDVQVSIDGRPHHLLEAGDTDTLEEAAAQVTQRTFKLLNQLLDQAGSRERAYRLREDFDATVVFLTPEQYVLMAALPGLTQEGVPEPVAGQSA